MTQVTKQFTVTEEMVRGFAGVTGDRNSLHMDAEIARRFRYRRPVVHGMLPVTLLTCLEEAFPGAAVTFTALDVQFRAPIFTDVEIRFDAEATPAQDGVARFRATWHTVQRNERLITASGTLRIADPSPTRTTAPTSGDISLLSEPLPENRYSIDELDGRSESVPFALNATALDVLRRAIVAPAVGRSDYHFCPNLAASLLLSTLTGMRLPGRFATFTSFKASFERTCSLDVLSSVSGVVEKVSREIGTITVSATFRQRDEMAGSARLEVLVNTAPIASIDCAAIKTRYLDLGIRDRVAVITGASRGIGEAAAKLFAMHGARAVVHYYRGKHDAEAIAAEIRAAGGTALALGCDIRNEVQVAEFFETIAQAYGGVDILVNNAVHDFRPAGAMTLEWTHYLEELEVSLHGLHNCCREAVRLFKQQGRGKIVNVSSVTVHNPVPGQSKYITAKSAVAGYTRSLAKELAASNIQVNLVVPNMTRTDLLSAIPPAIVERLGEERDYGRNLAPIEVALSMLYLASPWADGMTGQQIVLNLGEPPFA